MYIYFKVVMSRNVIDFSQIWKQCIFEYHCSTCNPRRKGVVVREHRSGKYFGAGTALRKISLAIGGTLTLKRSDKSRRTPLDQFIFWPKLPTNAGFGIKNLQKISGGNTPGPLPAPNPSTATRHAQGRNLPRCWDLVSETIPQNQNLPLHPCSGAV